MSAAGGKGFGSVPEMVKKTIPVPKKFVQLCKEYYHLDPVQLAAALIYEFTLKPPREIIFVSYEPEAEPKVGGCS